MKTINLDGKYIKVSTQIIEAFTPGVFSAQGVFETMLGIDGVVLDTALHLKRLQTGLTFLGVKSPSINPLILKEVLLRNHLRLARVRLMVWQAGKQIHVMITALPYQVSDQKYRVCVVKTNRKANSRFANVKSLDYELFAQAYAYAQSKDFDEALLLNQEGHVFEASRANIFWIKDKVLHTPPLSSGCLNGITRQQVIQYARNLKMNVKEKNLTLPILKEADTAFLTNSLIGIKPIELQMIKKIT